MQITDIDVLIVGAGLSGISAAYHLQRDCPDKSYVILEARESLGGTWDLFRYPGIRSDSDMYTLGFSFRPWRDPKAIADGPSILAYLRETAEAYGIDHKIRYGMRVSRARWDSSAARWTVDVQSATEQGSQVFRARFLYVCAGYYAYESGYTPDFPGVERFRGRVIHPQHWPEDLDYAGKKVVVIGSGATAVTLVPALAEKAAQVVMLQRSPTYIVSAPGRDAIANFLNDKLPARVAYPITRLKNVLLSSGIYAYCRRFPEQAKKLIVGAAKRQLGDEIDVSKHFTPSYKPWDQRLCLVPDGDLFHALRAGRASVLTDHIETFTEKGLKLRSGEELEADIIVTATGLRLRFLGGMQLSVDGTPVDFSKRMTYKGMMLGDVPNLAFAIGYTNASWTLKVDLTSTYVCRLLRYMDAHGYESATPCPDPSVTEEPLLDFTSGYVLRSLHELPRQGSRAPWKLYQRYLLDWAVLRYSRVEDGAMHFARAVPRSLGQGQESVSAQAERGASPKLAGRARSHESL